MTFRNGFLVFSLALSLLCAAPAMAKPSGHPKSLGKFGNWQTFVFKEKGQPVCYMALSTPLPKNNHIKRLPGHLTITHRPDDNSKDVVSYDAGYNFKLESTAKAHIGTLSFDLFTTLQTAWTRDAASDHKLTRAIRTYSSMTITGTPASKTKNITQVTDHIDLTGSSKAYMVMSKACGFETETTHTIKSKN
jgi:hypothetical protein